MKGGDRLARWGLVVLMLCIAAQQARIEKLERDTVRVVEVAP